MGDAYSGSWKAKGRYAKDPEYNLHHVACPESLSGNVPAGTKSKDLLMMPARLAIRLQEDGWWLRSEIIWAKPNPMPESVTDRPTSSHEKIYLLTKSARYYYDADAVREESVTGDLRRPYGSKGAWDMDGRPDEKKHGGELRKSKCPDGWDTKNGTHGTIHREGREPGATAEIPEGRNLRNVWIIPTQSYNGAHFATFPEEIPRRCISAGCPQDGTVLDPFAGSGTTLKVACDLNRKSIGIELNPDYCKLIKERVGQQEAIFTS
jgi:DNA modification methylase